MKAKAKIFRLLSGALLFCLSTFCLSQQGTSGSGSSLQKTWTVTPRVTLTETLTDNVNINGTSNSKQSDLITEVAPGVRITARTARLNAYFDYSLRGQVYAQSNHSQTQNSLNTFGNLEAIDNWLFLDFRGTIAQQAISAFGAQSPDSGTINSNSTETATYRLSPYIRGELGGAVSYLLRYNLTTTRSEATSVSNIDTAQWVGQLQGSTPFKNLSWTIDGNQQTTEYSNGRQTDAESLRAMGTYTVLPEFRVSLSAGLEANNYASLDKETHTTHGYGFDWNPTERTQFSAFKEKQFFGDGHNIRLSHRFPRSSISFTDIRNVAVLPNQFGTQGLGTIYDLVYQQLIGSEQYASMSPGIKEAAVASAVETYLANRGIDPNTQVTSGFLTSQATVQRRQQLALVLSGARNTVTFMVSRGENQSIQAATTAGDDLSQNNQVRQKGISLNLSHRLSSLSNLNLIASRQESTGSGTNTTKTTMTMYRVSVSTKLGAKTSGSLSARHSEFDSTSNPYTENALIGTVSFIY